MARRNPVGANPTKQPIQLDPKPSNKKFEVLDPTKIMTQHKFLNPSKPVEIEIPLSYTDAEGDVSSAEYLSKDLEDLLKSYSALVTVALSDQTKLAANPRNVINQQVAFFKRNNSMIQNIAQYNSILSHLFAHTLNEVRAKDLDGLGTKGLKAAVGTEVIINGIRYQVKDDSSLTPIVEQ